MKMAVVHRARFKDVWYKNAGLGSLSFLQGIFPTQESNQALLPCRRILYQLSYQGSPKSTLSSLQLLSCVWLFATPWTTQSMEFSRPEYWSGYPFPSPGDRPKPGIEPRSPALQADSLPAEPPGKPKNTGVGSLSLLQGIFPTQESNQGLLHCRWILYQLSYQGSPNSVQGFLFFPHPCQDLLFVAFLMAKIDLFVFISTLGNFTRKETIFQKVLIFMLIREVHWLDRREHLRFVFFLIKWEVVGKNQDSM